MDNIKNLKIIYNMSKTLDCFNKDTSRNLHNISVYEKYEIYSQYLENSDKSELLCKNKIWDHESFKYYVELNSKNKMLDDKFKTIELETGVTKCKRCGCEKNIIETKQTRCSDELTTVFVKCGNCNMKWIL